MTYFYEIGYGSPEESEFSSLTHESKLTEDDIDTMIIEAIIKIVEDAENIYISGYEDMHHSVIEYLVQEKGFEKVEYEEKWSVFGWPSLFDKEDWGEQRGEKLNKITEELNKRGYGREYDYYLSKEED